MKNIVFFALVIIGFNQTIHAQDSYKKRYYVKAEIEYKEKFFDEITGKTKSKISFLDLKSKAAIETRVLEIAKSKKGLLSNVAFGDKENDHRLLINPWLILSNDEYIARDQLYFYELGNRQSVKINFRQWSFNVLTVPLKIRFGSERTEFSSGANLGALIGHTWGTTNFLHRTKIGNKQYDTKNTIGVLIGIDKLEFSFIDDTDSELKTKTAVLAAGLGYLFSYEKFTFGVIGGVDYGLGENSSKWDFQGKYWLGITLGYSLFAF
jgi:hypothetical protein